MKVFHYSHLDNWWQIKEGSWKSDNKPGLGACRRIGREDMEAWNTCAVFALLEPQPKAWTENPHFVKIWDHLRRDIGQLLLEIDVDQQLGKHAFVIDRGLIQGFLEGLTDIPPKYQSNSRREAEHKYLASKTPLQRYLAKASELDYSLPEVIITEDVPFNKIQIAADQPFLEEYLDWNSESHLCQVGAIPELSSWREAFRERSLEQVQQR